MNNVARMRSCLAAFNRWAVQGERHMATATPKVTTDPPAVMKKRKEIYQMYGTKFSQVKEDYPLIPLFACLGFAIVLAASYTFRLATNNIDVTWAKNSVGYEPWQKEANRQWKMISVNADWSKNPNAEGAALSSELHQKYLADKKEKKAAEAE